MRKLSIVLTVLLSVLLAFVACDNSIDIGLDTKVEVKEIRLNETELDISTGDEETLVATVLPEDATDKSVTWSSSDEDVAKVDENGKVTGVGAGEATITVTSNSDNTVYETCSVKVAVNPYKTPLTLEFLEDGTFQVNYYNPSTVLTIEYSINGKERVKFEDGQEAIIVKKGDKVCFYRDVVGVKAIPYNSRIQCDSQCYVYGNVMSLIDSTNFATEINVHGDSLRGLFYDNTHIINHDEIDLVLPAISLSESCYAFMFDGCTGLTRAPELPADTLAVGCYASMFSGCESLETAPELPADTLAVGCYASMFSGCTRLTTAPVLPAKTLADYCYSQMFSGCESLETAPELPADTLAVGCYTSMFSGCTSLTTAPVLPAETLADYCYSYMFNGCSSLNSITCLANDISASDCTSNWVSGVAATGTFTRHPLGIEWETGSNGIPSTWGKKVYGQDIPLTFKFSAASDNAFTIINPSSSLAYSINGGDLIDYSSQSISVNAGDEVSFYANGTGSTSSAPMVIKCNEDCIVYGNAMSLISKTGFEDLDTLSSSYVFSSLFSGNAHLKSADGLVLPATTLTSGCYTYMFNGCTSLTKAPVLPATTLAEYCYASMFRGCTSLTTAPVLPAKTLADHCYFYMFNGCSSLNSITCLATSISASECTLNWVSGVAAVGTFTEHHSSVGWTEGPSGYPNNWTLKDLYN